MPAWLRVVAATQPVTQAVDAHRALLLNQPPGNPLCLSLAEFAGIIVIAFILATTLFKRAARAGGAGRLLLAPLLRRWRYSSLPAQVLVGRALAMPWTTR
jgi:hypothetical protein